MVIATPRAEIEARAKVTNRVRPLQVGGRTVHQVCLPWHWGTFKTNPQGVTGDSVNDLVAISGDPNVTIHESKAFRCDVRAGRRAEETTERLAGAGEGHDPEPERPDFAAETAQSVFRYGGENREI
jgi:formate dehydrogenase major subunit